MRLGTPRIAQGQLIEVSYGWGDDERIYRRTRDANGVETWDRADEESSSELEYDPCNADHHPTVMDWTPCARPREVES